MKETIIPISAFVLSAILAIIKIWETYRDRAQIEVGFSEKNFMQETDDVSIYNISKVPLIILDDELFWMKKSLLFGKGVRTDGDSNIALNKPIIDPYSSLTLKYPGVSITRHDHGMKLYLKLKLAGRKKPVIKLIHYPS